MRSVTLSILLVLILLGVIAGGKFLAQYTGGFVNQVLHDSYSQEPVEIATTTGSVLEKNELIRVVSPVAGAIVTSPLRIEGEARGHWYFEASFPVLLEDTAGTVLAEGPIQAEGEWMTTEFVPFSGELSFEAPTTTTGVLVLKKDNPSGLPEYDDEIRIQVMFGGE